MGLAFTELKKYQQALSVIAVLVVVVVVVVVLSYASGRLIDFRTEYILK